MSDESESWFHFTAADNGIASSTATLPFVIPAGAAGSVVTHAQHTNHTTGAAGLRRSCLPVQCRPACAAVPSLASRDVQACSQ